MSTMQSRTTDFLRLFFALACLLGTRCLQASTQVFLPTIVVGAHGANDSVWGTEVRVFNRSDTTKQFAVVDWIGTPGWKPSTYTIEGHSTLSIGGYYIYGGAYDPATPPVGLAVCDADDGLIVQTAVLGGPTYASLNPLGNPYCQSYDGGGPGFFIPCSPFAGPIVEGINALFSAGDELFVPWLHTVSNRRTNLVLFNVDNSVSHVTVTVTSGDGRTAESKSYEIPARSLLQLNDIFSKDPWRAIRVANAHLLHTGAASATIVGDTRLYAVAYVISSYNNGLTISLPR